MGDVTRYNFLAEAVATIRSRVTTKRHLMSFIFGYWALLLILVPDAEWRTLDKKNNKASILEILGLWYKEQETCHSKGSLVNLTLINENYLQR